MILASVKRCAVNVRNIRFQHALWPGALNLHAMLQWLRITLTSTLVLKMRFSVALWYLRVSNRVRWMFLACPFSTHCDPVPSSYISCSNYCDCGTPWTFLLTFLSYFYVEPSIKSAFLCCYDTCECQSSFSECSWHALSACFVILALHLYFVSGDLNVDTSIKVSFSVAIIPVSVKPCTMIVLSIPVQQVLWPGAFHLHFTPQWLL